MDGTSVRFCTYPFAVFPQAVPISELVALLNWHAPHFSKNPGKEPKLRQAGRSVDRVETLQEEIAELRELIARCAQFPDKDLQWARYLLKSACQRREQELISLLQN